MMRSMQSCVYLWNVDSRMHTPGHSISAVHFILAVSAQPPPLRHTPMTQADLVPCGPTGPETMRIGASVTYLLDAGHTLA
jgi:hypothetical protein